MIPLAPTGAAETVTKTWTQTSQTDFLQGSGDVELYSEPGTVLIGPQLSADVTGRWRLDAGPSNIFRKESPYVSTPNEGSIYSYHFQQGWGCGGSWGSGGCMDDRISTPAPGQSSFRVHLLHAGGGQQYAYDAWQDLHFRVYDGTYAQDTFLTGIRSSNWNSYYFTFGPYTQYVNINGWWWYVFDVNVPGHFNLNNLRAELRLTGSTGHSCWSNCGSQYVYMTNYVAFGMAKTGTFTSNIHNAGGAAKFEAITFDGTAPSGTSLKVQTRTSGNGVDWSPWATALSGEPVPSPGGSYIQYRALFTGDGKSAPRLNSVQVAYSITVDTTPPRTIGTVSGAAGCAGWIVTSPIISLSAQDDLSGVKDTFVSVDEGFFNLYTGPFTVADGVHKLEFYSTDNAGNIEAVKSLGFKSDTAAPGTTLGIGSPTYQGDRLYVAPGSVFTLDATDATSGLKATRVDTGAGSGLYGGAFTLGAGDGARSVRFASEDKACNVEATQQADVFVDGTAPTLEIRRPAPSSFSILGQQSESVPELAQTQEDLAALGIYGSDADALVGIVLAGAHEVCGPTLAEDCAALALAGLAPAVSGSIVVGEITVEADAADPAMNGGAAGMAMVAFYLDGALRHVDDAAPYSWDWDATNEAMGDHELTVVALDNLGNAAMQSVGVSVIPAGVVGALETGSFVLDQVGAPAFAHALYDFVRGKVEATGVPQPPPLPTLPPIVPPGVVPPPPPLPVQPPAVPGVPGVPSELPDPADAEALLAGLVAQLPPPPPIPRVCVGATCVPP